VVALPGGREQAPRLVKVVLDSRALGFSTLFGALSGPALAGFRVWWHFLMNLAVTVLAVLALWGFRGREAPVVAEPVAGCSG
jgi:hypothetical protein